MIETSRLKHDGGIAYVERSWDRRHGTVLVVEDELAVARTYQRVLSGLGYDVLTAGDAESGRALLQTGTVDAVISDLSMPGADGLELLAEIRAADAHMPVIIATGDSEERTACRAVERGALLVLQKPVDVRGLVQVVDHAMRLRRASRSPPPTSPSSARSVLERAVAELWVAYVPIVYAPCGLVTGYEAQIGANGLEFSGTRALFAAAEHVGCVVEVGRALRARVAADLAAAPRGARIFVNLPGAALADDTICGPSEPLRAYAAQIVLQISQREALRGLVHLADRVDDLRAAGFQLCVDGLGSGYASLTALAQLRPSVVKLDVALVRDLDTTPAKRRIVGAVASMCRQMRIDLVAEGVDTCAERAALLELGCDLQQGAVHGLPERSFASSRPLTQALKRTEAVTVRPRPAEWRYWT